MYKSLTTAVHWFNRAWFVALLLAVMSAQGKRMHDGTKSRKLIDSRIVGGENAEDNFAPYQVSIQTIHGSHICGGVIIDYQWILTAGHCAEDYPLDVLRIIVGTSVWQEPGAIYNPVLAIPHCMQDKPFYQNDIAVMRLDRPIEFNERVKKIQMATEELPPGAVLTMTGWGSTLQNTPPSSQLQKINTTYISREECLNKWENDEGVGVGHICTLTKAGEGACNGDSGGPVVFDGKLVGLVNWGRPCAEGMPDMHASVVYYRDFIELARSHCTRWRG